MIFPYLLNINTTVTKMLKHQGSQDLDFGGGHDLHLEGGDDIHLGAGDDLHFGGGFLKDLPPSIKRYTCHGKQHFLDIIESEPFDGANNPSKYLLLHARKNVLNTIVDAPVQEEALISSFDTDEELVLITLMSQPHSEAADAVNTAILETLIPMGMFSCLQGFAGAKIRQEGRPRGKQADYGWGPIRRPRGQRRSPSVTLEVAYSETESKLNSDVRFWLNPEDGNANVCLTLRINRSQPEIRMEKWERRNDRPHRSQVTWIAKNGGHIHATEHPIVIPFESLFCRPSSRPGERDLEISETQLKGIADKIWEVQGW